MAQKKKTVVTDEAEGTKRWTAINAAIRRHRLLPKPLDMLTLDPVSVQVHARELRKVPESRGYGACSKCRQEDGGGLFFAELESTLGGEKRADSTSILANSKPTLGFETCFLGAPRPC